MLLWKNILFFQLLFKFILLLSFFQINHNGIISLNTEFPRFLSDPFPLIDTIVQLIAPFWSDVDTSVTGHIYYHNASGNHQLLERARNEVMRYFTSGADFQPTYVFIVTWDHVSFFGGSSSGLVKICYLFVCHYFPLII